ncbi:hypothetical protein ABTY98_23420 [Streptomyces sp. NPDC096040]|uniref:hypothetical protein n=1 Tax=Streptomyces sp. NPDC096040 TaxID=3155541 RepID=UPI0033290876
MRIFLVADAGLPAIVLTTTLAAVACLRLLAPARPTDAGSCDANVDPLAWRMVGVPVAVAFSLLTVLAWTVGVSAVVLLTAIGPPGPVAGPMRLVAPAGALLLAWAAARLLVRPSHRLFPDEPDESAAAVHRPRDHAA